MTKQDTVFEALDHIFEHDHDNRNNPVMGKRALLSLLSHSGQRMGIPGFHPHHQDDPRANQIQGWWYKILLHLFMTVSIENIVINMTNLEGQTSKCMWVTWLCQVCTDTEINLPPVYGISHVVTGDSLQQPYYKTRPPSQNWQQSERFGTSGWSACHSSITQVQTSQWMRILSLLGDAAIQTCHANHLNME